MMGGVMMGGVMMGEVMGVMMGGCGGRVQWEG